MNSIQMTILGDHGASMFSWLFRSSTLADSKGSPIVVGRDEYNLRDWGILTE